MKSILYFIIAISFFIVTSCDNNSSPTTHDNTVLKSEDLWIPDEWVSKFEKATKTTSEKTGSFDAINAKFKIESSRLFIDSNNSIIKSVKVTLLSGADNCDFHATIDKKQYNTKNDGSIQTFSIVSIDFYRRTKTNFLQESKEYEIDSKNDITEIIPNKK